MRIEPLPLAGACTLGLEPHEDARGFFARIFCAREFAAAGLPTAFVQSSLSRNRRRGTVRGLHFQWPPSREAKLVRCVAGALHDVLLDLRPGSPTYLQSIGVLLDAVVGTALFIPHGVAHGFQTLADDTDVLYSMTDFQEPGLAAGFHWKDPAFGIDWPFTEAAAISERDRDAAAFDRVAFEAEWRRREAKQ
jgi:dTDP-4-dehydrorhamnose 3,5-epimerase